MDNNPFQKHPSKVLQSFYHLKNYQGANPSKAKVLFVGKDPNWASNIECSSIFCLVEEYLNDGVAFWKKYNFHHPFLHAEYAGDGRKYHKAISRLNLSISIADRISFVELVGFPTTGMSSSNPKVFKDYILSNENRKHLIELDSLLNDNGKTIFLFRGSINIFKFLSKKTGLFVKFNQIDNSKIISTDLNKVGNLYFHEHLSMGISRSTLIKISGVINNSVNY